VRGSPDPAPGATAGLPQATETFGQANRRGQETRAERGQLNGAAGRPASQSDSVRAEQVYAGCFDVFLGLGDEEGFPHQGTIDFVDNQIDTNTGTLRMRGVFPNADRLLSPGLFVRIRLPMGAPHAALLVSEQALGRDQGQKFVFVVSDENKVRYRRVKVGRLYDGLREALPVSGARAVSFMASPVGQGPLLAASALLPGTTLREITEGLRHGEKVVVSGLQRIRDGAQVDPKMVDMLAPSAPPPTPVAKVEGASDQRRSQ
jgi:multidrug efflux pump subunit AcrA (membrane-fusion protein)